MSESPTPATSADATALDQEWSPPLENEVHEGRGFPVWIWGCGGGCLVALMLFIAGSVWFGNKMFSAFGPEAAWPVIAEIMPFGDERPIGYHPTLIDPSQIGGMLERLPGVSKEDFKDLPMFQMIILNRTDTPGRAGDLTAMLYRLPEGASEDEKRELLDAPAVSPGAGQVERTDVEDLEITLQGRQLKARRFDANSEGPANPFGGDAAVRVMELDLSEGRARPLLLQFMSNTEGVEVDEAALAEFFAPFEVWKGN